MIDKQKLRDELDATLKLLSTRNFTLDKDRYISLETKRKELQVSVEKLQSKRNILNQEYHNNNKENSIQINAELLSKSKELDIIYAELEKIYSIIPNIPDDSVPIGSSSDDNKTVRTVGIPRKFDFPIQDHLELGRNDIDFVNGTKISQSRFAFLKKDIAKLHRTLSYYMLELHINNGYTEIAPPYIVNAASMYNTGQLPKFSDDIFCIENIGYLIPTSEVPLTNLIANTVIKEKLPIKHVAYSPCFRSEAGSYGRDTRGLIRMHQFDKVEMVCFSEPEHSYDMLDSIVSSAEQILQNLELPYRVVELCTGDLGFQSAKTFDIEVWLPSQNTYREISSCSNCTDFQARRMKAKYKTLDGKNELVHTLNGSGLAIGRTLVAILENYQQEDKSINIPNAIQNLMGLTNIKP